MLAIPNQDPCVFCQAIGGTVDVAFIHRDDEIVSFVDNYPFEPGHSLIAPLQHCTSVLDIPQDILLKAYAHAQHLARSAVTALGATGVNIFQNNGLDAGQKISHYHIHVLPRYPDSDFDEVRRRIEREEMAIFQERGRLPMTAEEGHRIAETLRKALFQ